MGKDWEILPILNGFATARRVAQLPCFMVETPVRNSDFYGRKEALRQLDDHLLPSQSKEVAFSAEGQELKHVVICGIGGIGKTSIAIEYAFSRRDKFDAIFWIRADEAAKIEQGLSARPELPHFLLTSKTLLTPFTCQISGRSHRH